MSAGRINFKDARQFLLLVKDARAVLVILHVNE